MRDPELERYVNAIEEHLGRRRGRECVLSPPDFDLARRWYAAGIPVGNVVAAIDALAAEGREPTSLALCRRQVEARPGRAPLRGAGEAGREPARVPVARPEAIRRALDALDPRRAALFPQTRAALAALGGPEDREGLLRLEEVFGREAVASLDPAALEEVERRVARAVSRQRGRVSDAALEEARSRQLRAAALRSLGLEAF